MARRAKCQTCFLPDDDLGEQIERTATGRSPILLLPMGCQNRKIGASPISKLLVSLDEGTA
jgi:hypothetical protein